MFRFSAFRIRTKLSLNIYIYTEAQALTDSDGGARHRKNAAPAASIASPIAPWPKSKSFGNMPARMSFLRTLSSRLKLRP